MEVFFRKEKKIVCHGPNMDGFNCNLIGCNHQLGLHIEGTDDVVLQLDGGKLPSNWAKISGVSRDCGYTFSHISARASHSLWNLWPVDQSYQNLIVLAEPGKILFDTLEGIIRDLYWCFENHIRPTSWTQYDWNCYLILVQLDQNSGAS